VQPCETEVDEHGAGAARARHEHDVLRLDVAMKHAERVCVRERAEELACDRHGAWWVEPEFGEQHRRERRAVEELHRDVLVAVRHVRVVEDPHAARVREPGDRARLALEPRLGVGQGLAENLERDVLLEREMLGAIDVAHAAAADQLDDAITSREHGIGGEGSHKG